MNSNQYHPIDSRLIVKIACEITGLRATTICKKIGLIDKNQINRFINGLKNDKKATCYWPSQETWILSCRTEANIPLEELIVDEQPFPLESTDTKAVDTLLKYIASDKNTYDPKIYTKEHLRKQKTFASSAYLYLVQLMKDELLTFDAAKQCVLDVCESSRVVYNDIQHIEGLNEKSGSIESLVALLIRRGMAVKGTPLWREIPAVSERNNVGCPSNANLAQVTVYPTDNDPQIEAYTYFHLSKRGFSTLDISRQLMENDAALYGGSDGLGRNAGSIEQWSQQIYAAPENWLFFCDRAGKIVGNWSFAYISASEEQAVRKGVFAGDDFSLGTATYHLASPDKEVILYLLNVSLNDGCQTEANWRKLWKNFGKRLLELITSGITIRRIYANLYREDHKALFRNMGFEFLVKNSVSGETYCLDLNKPSLSEFGWIIPDDLTSTSASPSKSEITFQQLAQNDILTEQQLLDIAGLIYDTDKYISEALFASREQAKRVLPLVFESTDDQMFRLGNVFCATYKGRVIGLILRKTGPLRWSADTLIEMAKRIGEELPETVERAEEEYFSEYAKTPVGCTAIINCCVNSTFRLRSEIRLGTHLMNAFLTQHEEPLELYVLRETRAAMRLYLHAGFKIAGECNGFSVDNRELPCYFMTRPAATDT